VKRRERKFSVPRRGRAICRRIGARPLADALGLFRTDTALATTTESHGGATLGR
jgi:hypothetical protein